MTQLRRGDVVRFRGKWRMVTAARKSKTGLRYWVSFVKIGTSWTDPCNRAGYDISAQEASHMRPCLRNQRVPDCQNTKHDHDHEVR